jgi:hypothetical protein
MRTPRCKEQSPPCSLPGLPVRLLLGLAVLVVLSTSARAQEAAFSSRNLAPEPVWQAQQGARAATGDEPANLLGNPAAIAGISGSQCSFSHLSWTGGVSREWACAAAPLPGGLALAADAAVLHTPALQGYDAGGRETGTFRPSEWNAGLTLAASAGGAWALGLGGRIFRLESEGAPLTGLGLSCGVLVSWGSLRAGLAVTDFGPTVQGDGQSYRLPTKYRLGVERTLGGSRYRAAIALQGNGERAPGWAAGFCARPAAWLDLLGGISLADPSADQGSLLWSCGFRVRQGGLAVSYAYHPADALGAAHQIGLGYELHRAGGRRGSS